MGGVFYNKFKFTISQATVSALLSMAVVSLVPCAASHSHMLFLGVLCLQYIGFGFANTMHLMVFEDAFDKLGVLWLSVSFVMTLAISAIGFYIFENFLGKLFSEMILTLIMGAFLMVPMIFAPSITKYIEEKNKRQEVNSATIAKDDKVEHIDK